MLIFSNPRASVGCFDRAQAWKWSNVARINLIAIVDLVASHKRQRSTHNAYLLLGYLRHGHG